MCVSKFSEQTKKKNKTKKNKISCTTTPIRHKRTHTEDYEGVLIEYRTLINTQDSGKR